MVWTEWTLKARFITYTHVPHHWQEHLPLEEAAHRPTQPGLEQCRGWGDHNHSGQPVPVPYHP